MFIMARQLYENEDTKKREKNLAYIIKERFYADLYKVSIKYGVDCLQMRGKKPIGWVELRCRSNKRQDFPTLMISLSKVQKAKTLLKDTNLPVTLFVEWEDCIGYVDLGNVSFTLGFGGRNEMRDWQDQEPVCFIDTKDFKLLEEQETVL